MKRTDSIKPHADYGFFGPESMVWKVATHPAVVSIGFQRTVLTEVLDPRVMASIATTRSAEMRLKSRYDRTLQYTAMVIFADSAAVVKAADTLMRIHRHMIGPEPVGGGTYDALDPAGQLWILITEWHSILYVYERFGPGKLTEAEEQQYWAECAIAAQFQTIDPDSVPRSRQEVREYFERVNPTLAASIVTRETTDRILNGVGDIIGPVPRGLGWVRRIAGVLVSAGTVATLPPWARRMTGARQSPIQDLAVTTVLRVIFNIIASSPRLQVMLLRRVAPLAHPVIAPVLLEVPPKEEATKLAAEAWRAAGLLTPREQWLKLRREVREPRKTSAESGQLLAFTPGQNG